MSRYRFTSESVTKGHPDKLCNAVSNSILDALLAQDKHSRVACETLTKTGMIIVTSEITTNAIIDYPTIVRSAIREIGYTSSDMSFDATTCAVLTAIEKQSPDISQGVTESEGLHKEQGAGDQGLMFGFTCDETPNLMPTPIDYAHQLARQLTAIRKSNKIDFLRPDDKTQITLEYKRNDPIRMNAIVISSQHSPDVKYKTLRNAIVSMIIEKIIPKKLIDKNTKFHMNPTNRFVIDGPQDNCKLTDRKIIIDTYDGIGRHDDDTFNDKDPSKVDRSACYYARYVAKNVIATKLASRYEVQIAYAIDVAQPVDMHVNTFDTDKMNDETLEKYILANFDIHPKTLIDKLDLLRPIYKPTTAYGHFNRSKFSQEKTTRATKMTDDLLRSSTKSNGNNSNDNDKKKPTHKTTNVYTD